jgi:small subunit ribosomal protein S4e
MTKAHLKRINAPKEWPIPKKQTKYVARPLPGSHSMQTGMPIVIILRDILKRASTTKEVKKILGRKEILVDGRKVKDKRQIVGLMDIISIPELKENYIIQINKKGKLEVNKIEEAHTKMSKVTSKKMEKGKIKLGTHDGRTIITDKKEINTGDTLLLKIPEQEIKQIIKLEKGSSALMMEGKYKGETGKIENIKAGLITVSIKDKQLMTDKKSIFIVG